MIKLLFTFSMFLCLSANAQKTIYDHSVIDTDGKSISLGDFSGSKILIAAVNYDELSSTTGFIFWDSLQKVFPDLKIVLMPAIDMNADSNKILSVNTSFLLNEKMTISSPQKVKQDEGADQNDVMDWLTDVDNNFHFQTDVKSDRSMFVISESGVLYAILDKGSPLDLISQVLQQKDIVPDYILQPVADATDATDAIVQ